jgi:hypothetical protein
VRHVGTIGKDYLGSLRWDRLWDNDGSAARFRDTLRYVDLVGGAVLNVLGLILLTGNIAVLSHYISNWLDELHINWISKF